MTALRHWTGHYCPACGWYRYGKILPFGESEQQHRYRTGCTSPLKITSGYFTAKDFRRELDQLSHSNDIRQIAPSA